MSSIFICKRCESEVDAFLVGEVNFKLTICETNESDKGVFEISFAKDEKPHMDAKRLFLRCPHCLTSTTPFFSIKEKSEYHKKLEGNTQLLVKTRITTLALYHGDKIQIPISQIKQWNLFKCKSLNKQNPSLIRRQEL